MEPVKKSYKGVGIGISVVVVALVAGVSFFFGKKPAEVTTPTPTPSTDHTSVGSETTAPNPPTNTPTTPVPPVTKPTGGKVSVYKNGTYSATGSYMSPGGEDQIAVTLTLANDIVTDVSVIPQPGDRTSARYEDRFASGYKQYVVGQNIANINITWVSGSSLTPIGFNDALAQIKAQAKA